MRIRCIDSFLLHPPDLVEVIEISDEELKGLNLSEVMRVLEKHFDIWVLKNNRASFCIVDDAIGIKKPLRIGVGKPIKMRNKLLFDEIDRKIIREFYKNPSWWGESMLVTSYKQAKICSKLKKEINKNRKKILWVFIILLFLPYVLILIGGLLTLIGKLL